MAEVIRFDSVVAHMATVYDRCTPKRSSPHWAGSGLVRRSVNEKDFAVCGAGWFMGHAGI